MPTEWSEGILLAQLADEPELAEEFSAIFARFSAAEGGPLPHVVLDFGGVSYLNSSHIAQMLRMRKKLTEARRQLLLCSMSDELWSVMSMTGLDKVFTYAPDTMTALARAQLADNGGDDGRA
ncbi:MAG: STAS domain-containing protein [Phycisphaerales bacterium]|nr:STAS domain-containing protein [Phycisphaerales bacterium]